jgi:phospholipid/cholesterol/gamma-HCH transport system permease protein
VATRTPGIRGFVEGVGEGAIRFVEQVGGLAETAVEVVRRGFLPPYRPQLFFEHMEFIGNGSTVLVCLTGIFTGMVFAKQTVYAFSLFRAQSLVGPTVALTLARELAPVLTALMVTMRAGSAICTELGTMRVTEQIDALSTIAVNPSHYLIAPRVIAATIMVPALSILFDAVGMLGCYLIVVYVERLSPGTLLTRVQSWVDPEDLYETVIKGAVFGLVVILIACFKGFNARGGSKGVGRATTEAMVMSAVAIFFLDYVLDLVLVGSSQRQ